MTTKIEETYSGADSGETLEERREFLRVQLANTVFAHYDDAATGDQQFAYTD